MSEPSSLFARIHLSKENLASFLAAPPKAPVLNDNWINWWNSRRMYSPSPLGENDVFAYQATSNKQILDFWVEDPGSGTIYEYDESTQVLDLGILMFSENFSEMIPMLAFILSLEDYKDDNKDDFAIVYPYFWGDTDVQVFITFDGNKGILDTTLETTKEVDAEKVEYAGDYLNRKASDAFPQD